MHSGFQLVHECNEGVRTNEQAEQIEALSQKLHTATKETVSNWFHSSINVCEHFINSVCLVFLFVVSLWYLKRMSYNYSVYSAWWVDHGVTERLIITRHKQSVSWTRLSSVRRHCSLNYLANIDCYLKVSSGSTSC